MPCLTAKVFPQELLDYYDCYVHGKISKCEFLNLAAEHAVDRITALTLFDLFKPNYTLATQVESTDPETIVEYIMCPSPNGHGEVQGYLVRSTKVSDKTPAVVVVYENRGLNPYIENVTWRVTKEGCIVLAPNDLSSVGGYPGNDDKGRELQQQVDPTKLMNGFFVTTEPMQRYSQVASKVYINRFCYDGGTSNTAVVAYPELACAVLSYRRQVPTVDVAKIEAPLLLRYAEPDSRINEGWPAYETALKANNKVCEAYIYPGVNHGFYDDSTPRYDKSAAGLVR